MTTASTAATLLKGLLSSPVNPASCSCARGLAVAITELAGAVPGLGGLASASATTTATTTTTSASAHALFVPSRATWGSSTSTSASSTKTQTSTAVERLQAELRAPPPPPELAADGLVASREAVWRQRLSLLD